MSDYDRENWQAEQSARDEADAAYRDKMSRARERSAANAKRKIARLHAKLTELGHISEFEDEFGESVLERLDKFGSAFHDREKGRAGDALSIAQKQVVARMKKKVKDLTAKQKAGKGLEPDPDADYVRTADRWKKEPQKRGGFKSKRKPKFSPRVRHIEEEIFEDMPPQTPVNPQTSANSGPPKLVSVASLPKTEAKKRENRAAPYIPKYVPRARSTAKTGKGLSPKPSTAKRPFLRIVPKPE